MLVIFGEEEKASDKAKLFASQKAKMSKSDAFDDGLTAVTL